MDNKLDSLLLVVLFITTMTFLREDKRLINQLNDSFSEAEIAIIQQQKNHQEN
ncbi:MULTISPECIES: hypothetical protein [Okeania]|uniref:hypothetical protein n=1 Tax=Okeania TaxID=1458928 RepID=UPI001374C7BA|nr:MULTISPECIES: hypothetical protein [Okeania]NET15853.1 hypothetical protein [Okeania sp. SIO1H6]NES78883.1 hypothetical protein [Okeania sp. SIO1H4]NES93073.1 hypothetical protein [Okeania sp. SIO2B9]NET22393.1 hypothetical protein [Okeania sp. SIO1H5]NET79118.1 hypothetical protein [Okeania sp. SIO1F9]